MGMAFLFIVYGHTHIPPTVFIIQFGFSRLG